LKKYITFAFSQLTRQSSCWKCTANINVCLSVLQQPTITNPRRVQMFDLVVKVRIQLTDINHRPLVGFPQEFPALVRHCISAHKQLIIVNLFFHHLKNVTTLLCKMHNFFI